MPDPSLEGPACRRLVRAFAGMDGGVPVFIFQTREISSNSEEFLHPLLL
jgi:hypothetical protein